MRGGYGALGVYKRSKGIHTCNGAPIYHRHHQAFWCAGPIHALQCKLLPLLRSYGSSPQPEKPQTDNADRALGLTDRWGP